MRKSSRLPGETPPDSPSGEAERSPELLDHVSPFMLHGGISFFVGLAVGIVVRMVFRTALVIAGIVALGIFGLSYANVIGPVDWKSIEDKLAVKIDQLNEKTSGLQNHILLSLPSAGLAGAGIMTGFRRR